MVDTFRTDHFGGPARSGKDHKVARAKDINSRGDTSGRVNLSMRGVADQVDLTNLQQIVRASYSTSPK